jgi:3'-phosphoadenosine 5'-phosphosulfate sulfotransferase (PAPS reductase)/FAD synthetase
MDTSLAHQMRNQETNYQVENVFSNVPLEHWDGDQVWIGQDATNVDANVHVKK